MSKWEKLYKAQVEVSEKQKEEIEALRDLLVIQVRTNDKAGQRMTSQHEIMQEQIGDHNKTVNDMGEEISRLRALVGSLGGDPDGSIDQLAN